MPETSASPRILHNLSVPMRDGTQLALDLVKPEGNGPWPVVFIRTCYDKVPLRDMDPDTENGIPYNHDFRTRVVEHGYALAVGDVRGRFNSDGEWYPYKYEAEDGHDTVEWIAQQPWCDGNVGMVGRSYAAFTQWAANAENPKGMRAIVPIAAQPDLWAAGFPVFDGIMQLPMGEFQVLMGRHSSQVRDFMGSVFAGLADCLWALPAVDVPRAAGAEPAGWWLDMMDHPDRDEYWEAMAYDAAGARAPALNVSGWYDLCLPGALRCYTRVREGDGPAEARDGARLLVGPWSHWAGVDASTDNISFGDPGTAALNAHIIEFLDQRLRRRPPGSDPRVRLFVMGANEWRTAEDWPLPEARTMQLWLHSGGGANTASGDGRLSSDAPGDEQPDSYAYDPNDPVVAAWSMHGGPEDDRAVDSRRDVLCYTGEPLDEPLDVIGPLRLVLHASSSAPDTDWHVRLVDVHPSGYAQFLSHGVMRARYRKSFSKPELLSPGVPDVFDIDLGATANRFLPGHRIRLEITSSWFPRFERNLNTGAANPHTDVTPVTAQQTIFHDAARASHVILQVV